MNFQQLIDKLYEKVVGVELKKLLSEYHITLTLKSFENFAKEKFMKDEELNSLFLAKQCDSKLIVSFVTKLTKLFEEYISALVDVSSEDKSALMVIMNLYGIGFMQGYQAHSKRGC